MNLYTSNKLFPCWLKCPTPNQFSNSVQVIITIINKVFEKNKKKKSQSINK